MTTDRSDPFPDLPVAQDTRGKTRVVGVEFEFAGLTEEEAAEIVQRTLGGDIASSGNREIEVENTSLGTIKVELDTALREHNDIALVRDGLDLARGVIPVEIVTDPLEPAQLPALDKLRANLRERGAEGSRQGMFLGFGLHLNPAVVAADDRHTVRTILAFGLLEDWLRETYSIDTTRRVLPFIKPWPPGLVDALVSGRDEGIEKIRELYADATQTRDHGLDLLPLFKSIDADAFAKHFPDDTATSARPAFHFRLPDCRIDEADWSLADPWREWVTVEQVAADEATLSRLCDAWLEHRESAIATRGQWAETVGSIMNDEKAMTA